MTDSEYMQFALKEAQKAAEEGEIPIGAVLVYRDMVIAAGHNRKETDRDPTAHAEVLVLREGGPHSGQMAFDGGLSLCYHRAVSDVRRGPPECKDFETGLRISQSPVRSYRIKISHHR